MATVTKFEELEIWKLSRELYSRISQLSISIKTRKEFRFAEQMKSAAGSVMDNIAEGFERCSRLEFLNSLSISKGETGDLKSQLYRCLDDKFISESEFQELYEKTDIVSRKIASFIIYLNRTLHKGLKFKDRSK